MICRNIRNTRRKDDRMQSANARDWHITSVRGAASIQLLLEVNADMPQPRAVYPAVAIDLSQPFGGQICCDAQRSSHSRMWV
jgi:hypothetical protein